MSPVTEMAVKELEEGAPAAGTAAERRRQFEVIEGHGHSGSGRSPLSIARRDIGVSIKPGETELTVIPFGPNSAAMERVSVITPPLLA